MKNTVAIVAALAALASPGGARPSAAQSPVELFETRVRPVLAGKCADCHARVRRGGLRLDSRENVLRGGQSGPAIVPGDPDASLLIQVVRHEVEGLEMPQDAPALAAAEIEGLAEWIRMGAPWPDEAVITLAMAEEGLSPSARLFVDRVQPVLTQKCHSCHTDRERGGLRLDSRERMLQGGGRGPAVIPGNPEQSLLIAAVRHVRDDLRMPRDGDPLSEQEIEGLVEWIRSGAEWAESASPMAIPRRVITDEDRAFWSFQRLSEPAVPDAPETATAHTDVDRLVLAKLKQMNLSPVAPASREQLIRRATFDLVGLPPTPEEVRDFVVDTSPDAFEKVVDRLLASPHYGERWGRHWLDVARYGEDDTRGLAEGGSGRERYPSAYVYRDWVVRAINDDMPYDMFVKAQLAADLMEGEDRKRALPGLGFLGGGPWYYDLADPPIARADERHDRVDVTTRGFLGLTVGCARCHDHKYDPIGTHDYYALAGIFNNTSYHEYPVAEEDEASAYEKDKAYIEALEEGLSDYLGTESDQLARVLSLQASDYMMAAWKVTGEPQLPVERAAAEAKLDLEALQRWIRFLGKEPKHYPFLVEWQAMMADEGGTEDGAQELADAFQRLLLEIVAEQEKLEERNSKIIAKGTPLEEVKSTPMPNGFESFFDQHQLELETMDRERFNLYLDVFRSDLDNELDTFFPQPGLLRFRGWGLERQLSRVAADHVAAMREEIEKLKEELPDLPFVMGVAEKEPADITDIALHIRGSPTNLGGQVPRSFVHVLSGKDPQRFIEGSGRLELAEAIAAHPITARVIVNRVWRWHMGSGIVDTPSNFGIAGERPTNPELLEYLAAGFVENGRSLRWLHREIMRSAVYQLGTGRDEANERVDAENRYYWRANRRRLDAESIRDALLHVAGTLDAEVGGPSLQIDDDENDRRTIYAWVSRFQLDEYLQIFDFPNPSLTAERRYMTNVPLQSLFFMNSDFVQRQAEHLVERLAKEAGGVEDAEGVEDGLPATVDDRAMIAAAYALLYARQVTEVEVDAGLEFLTAQRSALLGSELADLVAEAAEGGQAGVSAAEGGTAADPRSRAERSASKEAWIQYARALFSAAEFRFVD
jgi:mono/diheme cytochrome c family protein